MYYSSGQNISVTKYLAFSFLLIFIFCVVTMSFHYHHDAECCANCIACDFSDDLLAENSSYIPSVIVSEFFEIGFTPENANHTSAVLGSTKDTRGPPYSS